MPSVDYGIIVANDGTWLKVKPKCPYCGHVESDWSMEHIGVPKNQDETHSVGHTCSQCRKSYRITAYKG